MEQFPFRLRAPFRPVFLANRNLEPLYNVGCVLKAFGLIQARLPEAQLIVAGDGSERGDLEKLTSDLDLRNVKFVGKVPPHRMHEYYNAADIYLNSSEIDNMPGSILEAFAAGLPVVSTNAGGIPYIVQDGETGLLVERGDHQGMAREALRLLQDHTLASRIVSNARKECFRYTWPAVRDPWINLYHELVSKPPVLHLAANKAS